jgi:acyl carrier protein
MTPLEAKVTIQQVIRRIVPDADFDRLADDDDMREEFELDSLDFLSLIEDLSTRTRCRIDEDDYEALRTMHGAIDLLVQRSG